MADLKTSAIFYFTYTNNPFIHSTLPNKSYFQIQTKTLFHCICLMDPYTKSFFHQSQLKVQNDSFRILAF